MMNWFQALRPKTFIASVLPWWIAMAICATYNAITPTLGFVLLSCLCIQIGTNLINDASDFKKGADTSDRLGPHRLVLQGSASAKGVMQLGFLFFGLAALFGIPVILKGGLPFVVVGLLSLVAGYAYTAGPFPLAYWGLGDLFVFLFFGLVATLGTCFLQLNFIPPQACVAGVIVGCLSTLLIIINNLRDEKADTLANKRTLVVLMGRKWVLNEVLCLLGLLLMSQVTFLVLGFFASGVLPFVLAPWYLRLYHKLDQTEPSPIYNFYLAHAAKLNTGYGLLLGLGFLIDKI